MDIKAVREKLYADILTGVATATNSRVVPIPTTTGELAIQIGDQWFTVKVTAKKKFDTSTLMTEQPPKKEPIASKEITPKTKAKAKATEVDTTIEPKVSGETVLSMLRDLVAEQKKEIAAQKENTVAE
jgi:hypothetical protein